MTTLADRDRARSKQYLNSERIKDTEKSVNIDTDYGHKPEDDGDSGRHDLETSRSEAKQPIDEYTSQQTPYIKTNKKQTKNRQDRKHNYTTACTT